MLTTIFSLGLLSCGAGAANPATDAPRPNIVLIMADDMGYSDLGCYGSEINTPNLDRLAAGGLRFTQFYNTARCCPTRASLLTGLYAHQAGVGHMMGDDKLPGYRGDLSPNCVTIAEVLKPAGYSTYMVGKWHVTRFIGKVRGDDKLASEHNWPRQRGFDKYYGLLQGGSSYFDPLLVQDNKRVDPQGDDYYLTDDLSDHATRFIGEHVASHPDKPFFMYVAYTAPHWPLHARPEDVAKYRGKYDEGWDAVRTRRYERMVKLGIIDPNWRLTPRDVKAPPWENAEHREWQARRMEVYAAQVDRLDQGVGRIVRQLDSSGILDNTLILFLSDNGGCAEELSVGKNNASSSSEKTRNGKVVQRGNRPELMPGPVETHQSYGLPWANVSNTPFRLYKHWVHEGGISTPLIVHWPKIIKQAGFTSQVGHVIDLMATCVDVAGAAYPTECQGQPVTPLEGRSFAPALRGQVHVRDPIFWEHEGNRAVRQGNWKLVSRFPDKWELYDLQTDRTEMNDLAEQKPDKVAELKKLYEAWAGRANVADWAKLHPSAR